MLVSLVFEKVFTAGQLNGLTYIDWISFTSHEAKLSWLDGVSQNESRNGWHLSEEVWNYPPSFNRETAIEDYEMWH